jgi:hypothetical protein
MFTEGIQGFNVTPREYWSASWIPARCTPGGRESGANDDDLAQDRRGLKDRVGLLAAPEYSLEPTDPAAALQYPRMPFMIRYFQTGSAAAGDPASAPWRKIP